MYWANFIHSPYLFADINLGRMDSCSYIKRAIHRENIGLYGSNFSMAIKHSFGAIISLGTWRMGYFLWTQCEFGQSNTPLKLEDSVFISLCRICFECDHHHTRSTLVFRYVGNWDMRTHLLEKQICILPFFYIWLSIWIGFCVHMEYVNKKNVQ